MLSQNRKLIVSVVIVGITLLAALNPFQSVGSGYIDSAFKRAVAGYTIARGLNGVISVAQGTEFAVQPAGVGINFTPGEILDPVNDLVERFSWIMLLSTSSLGVQKVLLSMSAWQGLLIGLVVAALVLLGVYWSRGWESPLLRSFLKRLFLLLLILRFMMPLIALANEWMYRSFLAEQYQSASAELESARENIGTINDEVLASQKEDPSGLVNRARELYRSAVKQIDFEKRLDDYKKAAERISINTIQLIVVFLMQTLIFPLLFLWFVYTLIRRLFVMS